MNIYVTKTFLPPREEYEKFLDQIWQSHWLTNNGPILQSLEEELKNFLGFEQLLYVSNGTIAIQLIIKALELKGEVITTPYSYCATTTAVLWENCKPVFVDINPHDLNINADLIEEKITDKTSAILATHVYGNPCEVEKIEAIGKKYNIPVIYDAAHAFGAELNGLPVLNYGDASTCSFHATKVFHTIEGGSVMCKNEALFEKLKLYRSFGHVNDDYFSLGINAKNSEFHAAMGRAVLPHLATNIAKRRQKSELYDSLLDFEKLFKPLSHYTEFKSNYAYYPVVFQDADITDKVIAALKEENIYPRRYFYPSLNTLPYAHSQDSCPVSESVVSRVLSLPLYPDLADEDIHRISKIINQHI
ncbi:DegT/DnrJ/EryC1/StrS family aminotransferase [Marinilongibacter aquaticus]|uniref:DegT/DnrJ/EryC1/StrS family aminotransferase n=1 Tax=Marinilongibacter aquaticus TaxID=2975157 RepID=UPI0021BDD537|nr:DegT/DnrJ/EryC1/StrS family aminotransferase [Marinilongibacter aquaticus]UBM59304.1 DegT/DnrJ/EryC1/StrS family aminotransferase [Marinilongibacter aquaticus]